MEPGHHGWEGPCGDFYPIISNLSLHRGQGDERVLTRLAGISRKPLGPAAEIADNLRAIDAALRQKGALTHKDLWRWHRILMASADLDKRLKALE